MIGVSDQKKMGKCSKKYILVLLIGSETNAACVISVDTTKQESSYDGREKHSKQENSDKITMATLAAHQI